MWGPPISIDFANPDSTPWFLGAHCTSGMDLNNFALSGVMRHREWIQPDTYAFETLTQNRAPLQNDPMELTL